MKQLCVAGTDEFIRGFQLAGVQDTRVIQPEAAAVQEILEDEDIGILVMQQETVDALPEHMQTDLTKSVSPVVVALSTDGGASHLRQDIIRAIGVDLWKGE